MGNMLIKYVRDDFGVPFATIVALKQDTTFQMGLSICSPKDQFNKRIGKNIAIGRAKSNSRIKKLPTKPEYVYGGEFVHVNEIVADEIGYMYERAQRYFQCN